MTPWELHVAEWHDCQRCPLAQQRGRVCLARGDVPADVVFVGEAPGESEDAIGLPFKGPAGRLLDQLVVRAVPSGVTCAMTNLVACFPAVAKQTDDHAPDAAEIAACSPRLREFVALCAPRAIVFVGGLAEEYGPATWEAGLAGVEFHQAGGVTGHATLRRWCSVVHPAAVLRMPAAQRDMAARRAIIAIASAVRGACEEKIK